jgi:hypothetical protein
MLKSDPPRAYFSSVALAILSVAQYNTTATGSIRGILGKEITLTECPADFKPVMKELSALGEQTRTMMEADDENALKLAAQGRVVPEPRIDRVKKMLERGVGYEEREDDRTPEIEEGRRSIEGRSVQFANRLNVLALQLSRLPTFRERQDAVFEILAGSS